MSYAKQALFKSKQSNGTNAIELVAAVSGKKLRPRRLVIANTEAATAHAVIILDGTTELERYALLAGTTLVLTGEQIADLETTAGAALQFKLAASGTAVYVSGSAQAE